ncbi:MAG: hypothetical protein H7061_11215 [Bdellovibrionaceae bacterium]|nr:hypothetical protein [Bdellovibrio sp.]
MKSVTFLLLTSLFMAGAASAEINKSCQATCAYMDAKFTKRDGMFTRARTTFFKLNEWYAATGLNFTELLKACPGGELVDSYKLVYFAEQATVQISVEQGHYLTNVKFKKWDSCQKL